MKAVLCRVRQEERDTLFRLLQYSLFEESLTDLNEMRDDALFDYPWFEAYFEEPEREAFLIREQETGKLLGFAMVRQDENGRYSIAEFMVIPKYRRIGIGLQAAKECFALHAGLWEVKPAYGSEAAYLFWKRAVEAYAGSHCTWKDGLFSFDTQHDERNEGV